MKKNAKAKSPKSSRKSEGEIPETELPNFVAAMTKLVERLESVERKMDQVLGRVSSLPSEVRNAVQQSGRPNSSQPQSSQPRPQHANPQHQHSHSQQGNSSRPAQNFQGQGNTQNPGNGNGPRRSMFQAVCADCHKSCEVPFKPSDRPVYCKECFTVRKSSQKPQSSAPLSSRGLASAYVNKKAGYPPPALPSYRPQGAAVPGSTAVMNVPKSKPAKNSAKSKKKK